MAIADWLTLSETTGNSGTTVITITAASSTELLERLETLHIHNVGFGIIQDVKVAQTDGPYIFIDKTKLCFDASGGTLTIDIKSNTDWEIINNE